MKKILSIVLAVAMLATCLFTFSACGNNADTADTTGDNAADKTYTVGICQLVPHDALDAATKGFKEALAKALGEDKVNFIEQNAQNDATACTTIINDFVTKNVDLIMANATPALQAAANGTDKIPVLGTSVTEYGTALDIENFNGLVGTNVSGTSDLAPLDKQADMVLDIVPDAKKVGLLYCSGEANSAYQVKKVAEYLTAKGVECTDFPFSDSNDVASVAKAAAAASDVIYIPTDNTAASCAEAINGAVLPTKTPVIAGEEGICKGCGVATLSISYYDLGVKTGEMAAQILKGEKKVEEMEIAYADNFEKKYNKANCDELGIDTAKLEKDGYVAIAE